MKKEGIKITLLAAIFYGSLWGIAEAVLGYVLHLLPLGLTGFIMFPIGFYFMHRGYRQTQKVSIVFYIGIIAAAIKMFNLLLPFSPAIKVINPAVSIIFESVMVLVAFKLFVKESDRIQYKTALFACIAYRTFFITYTSILTLFSIPSSLLQSGIINIMKFILLEGTVNAGIIYVYMKGESLGKLPKLSLKPQYSTSISIVTFIAALAITGFLAFV